MNYNWNWSALLDPTPGGTNSYLASIVAGAGTTLIIAVAAFVIALLFGSVVGVLRTASHPWIAYLARAYVEVFRNIPLLVQLFLWYFVFPELLPASIGTPLKESPNAAFFTAIVALGLYTSPRIAELLKTGIQSLGIGQRMAGLSVGFTPFQTYRYVLLPMAYRIMMPPLTSEMLNVIKNSAVALTIGVVELTAAARSMQEYTFQVFEAFAVATVIYLAINASCATIMRTVESRLAIPGLSSRATKGR